MMALAQQGAGPQAFAAQCQGQALPSDQLQAAAAFQAEHAQDATVIALAGEPSDCRNGLRGQCGAYKSTSRPANSTACCQWPLPRHPDRDGYICSVARKGMNPAGYGKEALWTDSQNLRDSWRDLYNWPHGERPVAKPQGDLSQRQRDHLRGIQERSVVELMDILFASGRRSIESLVLACRPAIGLPAQQPPISFKKELTDLSACLDLGSAFRRIHRLHRILFRAT